MPCFPPGGLLGDFRMIRNPEPDGKSCVFTGERPTHDDKAFVPAPVKKGVCVCVCASECVCLSVYIFQTERPQCGLV